MLKRMVCLSVGILLMSLPVRGHHAQEFIAIESYSTIDQGSRLFHLHYDYIAPDKNDALLDRWEITPGLSWGVTDRLLFDAHTHYAKFGIGHVVEEQRDAYAPDGPPPFFEAVSFTLHYRWLETRWLNVAVSAAVELPFSRAKRLLDAEEVYAGNLILEHTFGRHGSLTLNLMCELEDGEEEWSYGLGIKNPISADPHGIAAGIEWLGEFDDFEDSWSIVPGLYFPLGTPDTIFKVGAEIGSNMDYTRARFSLLYNF